MTYEQMFLLNQDLDLDLNPGSRSAFSKIAGFGSGSAKNPDPKPT